MLIRLRTGTVVVLIAALLVEAPVTLSASAQRKDDWGSVSALKPGDEIVVKTTKSTVSGSITEVGPESVSLTTSAGVMTFGRQDVRAIWYRSPGRMKAGVGILIAAFACVAVQLIVGLKNAGRIGKSSPADAAPGIAAAGLVGVLIILAKSKGTKIYEAQ